MALSHPPGIYLQAGGTERYASSLPPFRFIDTFERLDDKRCRATKAVTRDEWSLVNAGERGWIFPWTLLLECMAQTAGTFDESLQACVPPKKIFVSRVRDVQCEEPPRPGDCVVLEAELIKLFGDQVVYAVRATVSQTLSAAATFYFARL